MENYIKNNFENAFKMRHESRKCWRLPDEVAEKALENFEEFGLAYENNDAVRLYDELAINALIYEKDEAINNFSSEKDLNEALENRLSFESENYYVFDY